MGHGALPIVRSYELRVRSWEFISTYHLLIFIGFCHALCPIPYALTNKVGKKRRYQKPGFSEKPGF
ncbi:MAG: hypothetical protein AAF630_05890 [Cyanobacteria bacterium P01_C01_bin.38]